MSELPTSKVKFGRKHSWPSLPSCRLLISLVSVPHKPQQTENNLCFRIRTQINKGIVAYPQRGQGVIEVISSAILQTAEWAGRGPSSPPPAASQLLQPWLHCMALHYHSTSFKELWRRSSSSAKQNETSVTAKYSPFPASCPREEAL